MTIWTRKRGALCSQSGGIAPLPVYFASHEYTLDKIYLNMAYLCFAERAFGGLAMYTEDDEQDDLEGLIAEIAQNDPGFPALVEAAFQRRLAMRARGEDPNDENDDEEPAQEGATDESQAAPPEIAAVHD